MTQFLLDTFTRSGTPYISGNAAGETTGTWSIWGQGVSQQDSQINTGFLSIGSVGYTRAKHSVTPGDNVQEVRLQFTPQGTTWVVGGHLRIAVGNENYGLTIDYGGNATVARWNGSSSTTIATKAAAHSIAAADTSPHTLVVGVTAANEFYVTVDGTPVVFTVTPTDATYTAVGTVGLVGRGVKIDSIEGYDGLIDPAPTLSLPSTSAIGSTSASFSVTTTEGTGTLFYLASANATETSATVIATGASQAVSATGVQLGSFTGLTPATAYYPHFAHRDAANNVAVNATTGTQFTTTGGNGSPILTASGFAPDTVFASTRTLSLDYGAGPGRAIMAFCEMDSGSATTTIDSCTAGGVAMTGGVALPRITNVNNKSRMFLLSGASVPEGIQDTVVTLSNANRKPGLIVIVLKDANNTLITFGGEVSASINSTSQSIGIPTSGTTSLAVAFARMEATAVLTPNIDTSIAFTANGTFLVNVWTGAGTGATVTLGGTTNTPTPTVCKIGVSVNGSIPAPTVTTQPVSTSVTEGTSASFTATFANSPTSFGWEQSDSPYSTWTAVAGGGPAATYETGATTLSMSGRRYRCTATNATGSVTTDGLAELTVTAAPVSAPIMINFVF